MVERGMMDRSVRCRGACELIDLMSTGGAQSRISVEKS